MGMFFTDKTYIEELGIKGGPQQGDTDEEETKEEPVPEDDEEETVPEDDGDEEEPVPEGDGDEEETVPEGDDDEEETVPENDDENEEPVPEDDEEESVPEGDDEEEPAPEGEENNSTGQTTTVGSTGGGAPSGGGESAPEGDGEEGLEEPEPEEGEEGEEDEEPEEGDSDGDGEADSVDGDNIQAMEDEIFSSLSPAQKLIKISELKGSFSKLYRSCDMIFNKLDTIPKSDDNLLVLERVTNTLSDLKQYIEHYLMYTFDTKTYLENETNLQKYISIFNAVKEIFAQISKQKA